MQLTARAQRPGRCSSATENLHKIYIPRNTRAISSVYDSAIMYRMDWTDERMDDFRADVDRRFDEVYRRFDAVDRRLDRLGDRFDALQRTLLLTGGGIVATLIAGIVSVLVTQL